MKKLLLYAIRLYQRILSPDTGMVRRFIPVPATCRYTPTCSQYTYEAVDAYGIISGLWLGVLRVVRCHPLSKGGFDPVPVH